MKNQNYVESYSEEWEDSIEEMLNEMGSSFLPREFEFLNNLLVNMNII